MNSENQPTDGHSSPRILFAGTPGGGARAFFQPDATSAGHAEVVSLSHVSANPFPAGPGPGGGGGVFPGVGVGGVPGFSVTFGWIWIVGNQPICKTRHVIGAADGTTFFVRATPAKEQFYFVGPSSSRVRLTEIPAHPGRPETILDLVNRFAEYDGRSLVRRSLSEASSEDQEFLALVAKARESAIRAGLAE